MDQPTICGFCSCGCAFYAESRNGRVAGISPSAVHPVSLGRLCFKGWNAVRPLLSMDRLQTPLVRKGEKLEPASWADAIAATASAIKRISSENGPDRIGVIGSAKTTNEECYSVVKLARGVIRTPNVDGACRFYDTALIDGLLETTGVAASQLDLNSLPQAGSMLIVGANPMDQLPQVGSRILDAVENGCRVIAADPLTNQLTAKAALLLRPTPGTDLVWLRALLREIVDRKLYKDKVSALAGFAEMTASLTDVTFDRLAETCGIDRQAITDAAQMLAENDPPVVMFGLGVLQQPRAAELVKALANVALLLGGSIVPLRGQNNAQGACDMGLLRDMLPGYAPCDSPAARKAWESIWDGGLAAGRGMSAVDMLRACGSGDLKALLVFGENVALSAPNTDATLAALKNTEFLAVADLYLTETAQLADVVFPACSFLEKDGTFTNVERRVQRVRRMVDPMGDSKPDLQIISELASALGTHLSSDPAVVMSEIASNVRQYAGVSYEALDEFWGRQWLRETVESKLSPVEGAEPAKDEEYPFKLIASRVIFHQQTGTMSARCSLLSREYPAPFAEMNEKDAERLGLRAGRTVNISSRFGTLTRSLVLNDAIPPGCAHAPHFFGGDSPNALAGYDCDAASGTPAYKACDVRIEAVE